VAKRALQEARDWIGHGSGLVRNQFVFLEHLPVKNRAIAKSIIVSAALLPAAAMAQLSANVGFVSDYIFRGFYQENSSASAGLDYESDNGFYIGTWGADVGDGLETDLYFGYGGGNDDFSWSIGFTGYYYTEKTFDDTYEEINLGIGAGGFAADLAIGEYDNFGFPVDYTFLGLSYTLEGGTSFLIAQTDYDGVGTSPGVDGKWLEIGHAWDIGNDVELSVTFLYSPDGDDPNSSILLSQDNPLAEHNLVLGISKAISIGSN
jgi:hypothetical protein